VADNTLKVLEHLDNIAKQASLPIEKVANVIRLQKKYEHDEQSERRSTPDERAAIDAGVAKLFGENPNLEKTPREIATELGIRTNQGNLSRISRTVKQVALTHQKAAE